MAIYNNVKGKDLAVVKKFRERTWNNPVVRFLDGSGRDLIPRKGGIYKTGPLLQRMALALEKAGRPVPEYLRLAAFELNPAGKETACFAMYCYWTGEKLLGRIEGVLATRIGRLGRYEAVEVDFDPTVVSYETLVKEAKRLKCAGRVFARTDAQLDLARLLVGKAAVRSDKPVNTKTTQQKHLSTRPRYHYLPLTSLQATKVNSAIAFKKSPDVLLSPGQLVLKEEIGRALSEDPKFLSDLKPDRTPGGLAAYAAALKKRLAEAESEF
ncbi:MAG: VPGUxxT family thioredoxin-like (seleno)protein, type 2 [Planctomycetota bacterium]